MELHVFTRQLLSLAGQQVSYGEARTAGNC